MENYKYSVLTYIFNGYDIPRNISNKQDDVEYILVTDDKSMTSNQWKIVYDEKLNNLSPFEKCYYVRFHPFEYVHSDIVVRIDGSVEIFGDRLSDLIDYFNFNNYVFSMIVHPERCNIVDEYNIWVKTRNYPIKDMDNVIKYIKNNLKYNFDNKLLLQENFVIEKKCNLLDEIDEKVYNTLLDIKKPIERIDQTITSIICSDYFNKLNFLPLSQNILTDGIIGKWHIHGSNGIISNSTNAKFLKNGYINNKLVDLYPYIKEHCILGVCNTEEGLRIKNEMLFWLNDYYNIEIVETDGKQFEYPGIKRALEKSIETGAPVLYLHTKGAVNKNQWQSRVRNMWKHEFTTNKNKYFESASSKEPTVVTPFTGKYKEMWFNAFVVNSEAAKVVGELELHLENRWYYEEFFGNFENINAIGIIYDKVISERRHKSEIGKNGFVGENYMWHYLKENYGEIAQNTQQSISAEETVHSIYNATEIKPKFTIKKRTRQQIAVKRRLRYL